MIMDRIGRNLGDSFSSRVNKIGKTKYYLIRISVVGNKKRM